MHCMGLKNIAKETISELEDATAETVQVEQRKRWKKEAQHQAAVGPHQVVEQPESEAPGKEAEVGNKNYFKEK